MRLPPDNSIQLREGENHLVVDASDAPAWSKEDVAALAPTWVRAASSAVRDMVFGALAMVSLHAWVQVGRVIAESTSPRFASGARLEAWGRQKKRLRAVGESEGRYRERLLVTPARTTPDAIEAVVETLALEVTPVRPNIIEPADDMYFVPSSASQWCCFVQPVDGRLWGYDPARPDARWGTYWHSTRLVAEFWVVIYGDVSGDAGGMFILPAGLAHDDPAVGDEDFVGDAPPADVFGYIAPAGESFEARVEREVQARKMGGVLWALLVDSNLVRAR